MDPFTATTGLLSVEAALNPASQQHKTRSHNNHNNHNNSNYLPGLNTKLRDAAPNAPNTPSLSLLESGLPLRRESSNSQRELTRRNTAASRNSKETHEYKISEAGELSRLYSANRRMSKPEFPPNHFTFHSSHYNTCQKLLRIGIVVLLVIFLVLIAAVAGLALLHYFHVSPDDQTARELSESHDHHNNAAMNYMQQLEHRLVHNEKVDEIRSTIASNYNRLTDTLQHYRQYLTPKQKETLIKQRSNEITIFTVMEELNNDFEQCTPQSMFNYHQILSISHALSALPHSNIIVYLPSAAQCKQFHSINAKQFEFMQCVTFPHINSEFKRPTVAELLADALRRSKTELIMYISAGNLLSNSFSGAFSAVLRDFPENNFLLAASALPLLLEPDQYFYNPAQINDEKTFLAEIMAKNSVFDSEQLPETGREKRLELVVFNRATAHAVLAQKTLGNLVFSPSELWLHALLSSALFDSAVSAQLIDISSGSPLFHQYQRNSALDSAQFSAASDQNKAVDSSNSEILHGKLGNKLVLATLSNANYKLSARCSAASPETCKLESILQESPLISVLKYVATVESSKTQWIVAVPIRENFPASEMTLIFNWFCYANLLDLAHFIFVVENNPKIEQIMQKFNENNENSVKIPFLSVESGGIHHFYGFLLENSINFVSIPPVSMPLRNDLLRVLANSVVDVALRSDFRVFAVSSSSNGKNWLASWSKCEQSRTVESINCFSTVNSVLQNKVSVLLLDSAQFPGDLTVQSRGIYPELLNISPQNSGQNSLFLNSASPFRCKALSLPFSTPKVDNSMAELTSGRFNPHQLFFLTIRITAFAAPQAFERLLHMLEGVNYHGDRVDLEVHIVPLDDSQFSYRSATGYAHSTIIALSKTMHWRHGELIIKQSQVAAAPTEFDNHFILLLDETVELSQHFYDYIKLCIDNYYLNPAQYDPKLYGISLITPEFAAGETELASFGSVRLHRAVGFHNYLYKYQFSSEAMLYFPQHARLMHHSKFNGDRARCVPGLVSNRLSGITQQSQMNRLAFEKGLYALYPNLPAHQVLARVPTNSSVPSPSANSLASLLVESVPRDSTHFPPLSSVPLLNFWGESILSPGELQLKGIVWSNSENVKQCWKVHEEEEEAAEEITEEPVAAIDPTAKGADKSAEISSNKPAVAKPSAHPSSLRPRIIRAAGGVVRHSSASSYKFVEQEVKGYSHLDPYDAKSKGGGLEIDLSKLVNKPTHKQY
jgi:hypothetical protein